MRATIVNDGRKIGLILFDELSVQAVKFPGLQGFTNPVAGVCDLTQSQLTPPSILDCTAQTFVPGGNAGYFWADDLHLSATAQNLFGQRRSSARRTIRSRRGQGGSAGATARRARRASLAAHSTIASSAGRAAFAFA